MRTTNNDYLHTYMHIQSHNKCYPIKIQSKSYERNVCYCFNCKCVIFKLNTKGMQIMRLIKLYLFTGKEMDCIGIPMDRKRIHLESIPE